MHTCDICGKKFANRESFLQHKSSHGSRRSGGNGAGRGRRGGGRNRLSTGTRITNIPGPVGISVGTPVNSNSSVGTLRVSNNEYWGTLTVGKTPGPITLNFLPSASKMMVLDGVASVYDNYRVHSARIHLHGMSATTSSSVVSACIDYEPAVGLTTQDGILRTVPNVTLPAYRDGELVANKASMTRRNWLVVGTTSTELSTAFSLTAWLSGTEGDKWLVYCKYDVEFRNPSKST